MDPGCGRRECDGGGGGNERGAKEDRATVYEAIVTKDDEWWNSRPHLRKKKEYLLEKIRSCFAYWPFAEE